MTLLSIAWLIAALLLFLTLSQAACVKYYLVALSRDMRAVKPRTFQPDVSVVLCLRGCDPSLDACLDSILDQQYDNYQVVCVLDNEKDPAYQLVRRLQDHPRLRIEIAEPKADNRSLKCNSLIHVFQDIQSPITVLVDADAVVDRHWLADLVAPLESDGVVASSANRWFLPPIMELGSNVRHFWNLAAAPQMFAYQVTWGGSLALDTDFVRTSGILDAWSKSLFEDATVRGFAKKQGKRVVMLPSLLIPNSESISLKSASGWIRRQLLDTKLYHACFSGVVAHAFLVSGTLLATVITLPWLWFNAAWFESGIVGGAFLLFGLFYYWAWKRLESSARQAIQSRGHVTDSPTSEGVRACCAILLTQLVYLLAVLRAIFVRTVQWRGIEYEVSGPQQIKMKEYLPMREQIGQGNESI